MRSTTDAALSDLVRESAPALTASAGDFDPVMDVVGNARRGLDASLFNTHAMVERQGRAGTASP